MTSRDREELTTLIKLADEQRKRIKALQTELELLDQRIARARGTQRPERRKVVARKK